MRAEFETRIVNALAGFRLPRFTEAEVTRNRSDFTELYQLGDDGFVRRFGERIRTQTNGTVRLSVDTSPPTRVLGRALYLKLQRGSSVLHFNYGTYDPPFDQG